MSVYGVASTTPGLLVSDNAPIKASGLMKSGIRLLPVLEWRKLDGVNIGS
jgi:hypothetical protein